MPKMRPFPHRSLMQHARRRVRFLHESGHLPATGGRPRSQTAKTTPDKKEH